MNITEKVQVIGISVLIALLLGAGVYRMLVKPVHTLDDTQDSPILIAGGSLYFGVDPAFRLQAPTNASYLQFMDNNYTAVTSRQFSEIDVEDFATGPLPAITTFTKVPKVVVTYCKNNCNGTGNSDTVTLQDKSDNSITITNTDTAHPISASNRVLPFLLMHQLKHDWEINSIDVYTDGTASTPARHTMCTDGQCSVIVHTCGINVSTPCQNH